MKIARKPTATDRVCRVAGMLIVLLLVATSAQATTVTVGDKYNDSSCDYNSLRDALAALAVDPNGPHIIEDSWPVDYSLAYSYSDYLFPYPADSEVHVDNPLADITIVGGYANCEATSPVPDSLTFFEYSTASTDAPHTLLTLTNDYANSRRTITLENIDMQGADNAGDGGPIAGGAILVQHNLTLLLENSSIDGFHAENGGGIAIYGGTTPIPQFSQYPLLRITGSIIEHNSAYYGGGILASYAHVSLESAVDIYQNQARNQGGGIWLLDQARTGSVNDPTYVALSGSGFNAIVYNVAGTGFYVGYGGGIYSEYGQINLAGISPDYLGGVLSGAFTNEIGHNSATGDGGGIFIQGPDQDSAGGPFTFVRVYNAFMHDNVAGYKGGALYSMDAVDTRLDSRGGRCLDVSSNQPTPCSYLRDNAAGTYNVSGPEPGGGAIYVTDDLADGYSRGIVRVLRTLFHHNQDPNGLAAVAATDGASEMVFNRDIFTGNSADTGTSLDVDSALIYSPDGKNVDFRYDTVLDNDVTRMFSMAGGELYAQGSILWGAVNSTLPEYYLGFFSGGATYFDNECALIRYTTVFDTLPAGTGAGDWAGYAPDLDALFAPGGSSPAIDNCDSNAYPPPADAYGNTVYDVPGVPPRWTETPPYNFDLGAVEQTDIIFANGFGYRPDN